LEGAIVCDSPVTAPDPEVDAARTGSAFGAPRTYTTVEEALARFRTVPPQDHYLPYVLDHVARRSLRPVEGGWRWKFDRQIFAQFGGGMRTAALPYLSQVRCRLALLRSEYGLVTEDIGADMYEQLGRVAPVIEIAEAGHHALLDHPLLLLTALRTPAPTPPLGTARAHQMRTRSFSSSHMASPSATSKASWNSSRLRTTLARNSGGEWGSMASRRICSASRTTVRHTWPQPRNTRWLPVRPSSSGASAPCRLSR